MPGDKFAQTNIELFNIVFMLPSIQFKSLHFSKKPGSERNFSIVFVAFHPLQSFHVNDPRRETQFSTNTNSEIALTPRQQAESRAVILIFCSLFLQEPPRPDKCSYIALSCFPMSLSLRLCFVEAER